MNASPAPPGRQQARRVLIVLCSLTSVAVVGLVLWVAVGPGAMWVLRNFDKVLIGGMSPAELSEALDRVRGRAVAIGTGLLAAVAIFFTARTARAALDSSAAAQQTAAATQQTAAASQQTAAATEQGMVTGRYTAAITQLGDKDSLDIRLGGVYALERIARDSERDHPTVMAVLAAFVREHSHDEDAHTDTRTPNTHRTDETPTDRQRFRPDLQDALTVIGRRNTQHDTNSINLSGADLRNADLGNAYLHGANLYGANLSGANLGDANLRGAYLSKADLHGADLSDADLRSANLSGADLIAADLGGANLRGADLRGANLSGADLIAADLSGADLRGANLGDANLRGAYLSKADLHGANLGGADLRGADLRGANLRGADLRGADLIGANLSVEELRAEGAVVDEDARFDPPEGTDPGPG
ncbi:pentapeptide repeat-containing protein [Actinocorallia populi]|uniref:pentapeptide repeat-containing protein n=1 Tax=Actinocorallia populi TaxID=2079200 RepID=UPI0013003580|nr:pentapeptide repeat-containing protein [Actinocorallia populi]